MRSDDASQLSAVELGRYLHEHIPLSKAMQVAIRQAENDLVVLAAPLAPNINHRETVFGGSASAVAILAAWSLLHLRLAHAGIACRLVIQRNTMEYALPIAGDFTASACLQKPEQWERFLHILQRKGRARIPVIATLERDGQETGRLTGEFVALANPGLSPEGD